MLHRPSPTLLVLALSAAFAPAWGQTAGESTLDPVIVRDSRLNAGEQRLSGAALDAAKAGTADTAGLLGAVPGVHTYGAGGVSSLPVIRGLADDRLRLQVDGMDLVSSCGNHMNPALSYIDPSNVASVEVYPGVTPVSVGGDSIGGTIRVRSTGPRFSKAGEGLTTGGEIGGYFRSNGDAWGAHVAVDAATESLAVFYRGSHAEGGNYRAAKDFKAGATQTTTLTQPYVAGNEVASSQYMAENHQAGIALRGDGRQLELKVGVQKIPYQGFPNQRMDMTDNESTQVNLRYTSTHDWGRFEALAYHEATRHAMNFLEAKQTTLLGMPMDTKGKTDGVQIKGDIQLSPRDLLRVGTEYRRYRLDDWWDPVTSTSGMMGGNVFWNVRDGQRDNWDTFAEWEAQWSPQWTSLFGLRYSQVEMNTGNVQGYNNDAGMMGYGDPTNPTTIPGAFNARDRKRTDNNVDLTALARYKADERADYEFGYARKTRSPNIYERYTWSTNNTMVMNMINWSGEANGYVGNLDLKPEVAHTVSATGNWHDAAKADWAISATPYYTYVQDYIDAQRCNTGASPCNNANVSAQTGFVYLQFVNQSAELYGATVSGWKQLGRLGGLGDFRLSGVFDYTRGKNKTTGDNLYNIMPLNLKLALQQQIGGWTNTLETFSVAGKHDVSQVRNETQTSGYTLVNLRASREWGKLRLDLGIDNLFDQFYYQPLGGAYVGQRTPAQTWGIPMPGMGRSLYAGFNLRF